VNNDGVTPLVAARSEGRSDVVALLEAAGAQANYTLYSAALEGNAGEIVRLLAVPGIEVNWANKDGLTPLYVASWKGRTEVVKLLLAAPGIDVNRANELSETPLSVATNDEIRALLRAASATV